MISLDFTGPAQDVNRTSCLVGDIAFDTYSDHLDLYLLCLMCFAHMYARESHLYLVPTEIRKWFLIPWNWNHKWL